MEKYGRTGGASSRLSQPADCCGTPRSSCPPVQGLGLWVASPPAPQAAAISTTSCCTPHRKGQHFGGSSWPPLHEGQLPGSRDKPQKPSQPPCQSRSPAAHKSTFPKGFQAGKRARASPAGAHPSLLVTRLTETSWEPSRIKSAHLSISGTLQVP